MVPAGAWCRALQCAEVMRGHGGGHCPVGDNLLWPCSSSVPDSDHGREKATQGTAIHVTTHWGLTKTCPVSHMGLTQPL